MNNTNITLLSDMDGKMPVAIFYGAMGIIGVIGNVLAFIFFYMEPTTAFIVLVTSLSANDLCVCIGLCLSGVDILLSSVVCKVIVSLFLIFHIYSTCIRVIIAIHQCRSTIHPFRRQLSVRGAKIAVTVCLIYCVVAAFRDCVVFEVYNSLHPTVPDNSTLVIQYTCWTVHGTVLYRYMVATLVYTFVAIGVCIAIICISYSLIVHSLIRHERKFKNLQKEKHTCSKVMRDIYNEAQDTDTMQTVNTISLETVETSMDDTCTTIGISDAIDSNTCTVIAGIDLRMNDTDTVVTDEATVDSTADIKQQKVTKTVSSMTETREERIKSFEKSAVVTMLWVSVGFIVATVLYAIAVFWKQEIPTFLDGIMLRGTFLYVSMSPIVYYLRIQRFREFVNKIRRFKKSK